MARRVLAVGLVALVISRGAMAIAAAPQEYHFTYCPLVVGDEARETLHFAIALKTVRSQQGQVVDLAEQTIHRNEQSVVVRLPIEPGQSAKAKITYKTSDQSAQTRGADATTTARPVDGKTYLVVRQGEDLLITDEQGETPPDDECTIVARTMDGLGHPSPLGVFFNDRALRVGQKVRLPAEFTEKLLSGWDENLAKMPLDVMLMGTERVDGALCALLHTPPAAGGDKSKRAPIDGKFLIELDTCRVAKIELRGPIATAERRGAPGQEFDVRRRGKLDVAVHVEHHRAR